MDADDVAALQRLAATCTANGWGLLVHLAADGYWQGILALPGKDKDGKAAFDRFAGEPRAKLREALGSMEQEMIRVAGGELRQVAAFETKGS